MMSKTNKIMIGTTAVLVLTLMLLSAPAFAQISINDDCKDKCEDNTLYTKGTFDEKARECVYAYEKHCEYGCSELSCNLFPNKPPIDELEYDETLWKMMKNLFDEKEKKITMQIHGTEYMPNKQGLVFLQLLDDDYNPINNIESTCYSSIYYPNSSVWKYQQLMSYADEGLFYYGFTTLDIMGVYMVSGYCIVPSYVITSHDISDDFESGDGTGGINWSANWNLNGAVVTGLYKYEGSYNLRMNEDDSPNRTFTGDSNDSSLDVSFYYRLASWEAGDGAYAWLIDGNGTAFLLDSWMDGEDDSSWHLFTGTLYRVADSFNLTGTMTLKFNTTGTWGASDYMNIDLINMTISHDIPINETEYQIVRGSSEVHITDIPFETYMKFATLPEPELLSNHDYCIDNQTLGKTLTWEICRDGKCDNIVKNVTEPCPYGCYGNITVGSCNPEPFDRTLFLIGVFVLIFFGLIVIALLYDRFQK